MYDIILNNSVLLNSDIVRGIYMRFVPAPCLRSGMVCAKPIRGKNSELLLNKGAMIQDSYVRRIRELGIMGIYIEDRLSEGIEFVDIITETQRSNSVSTIKSLFENVSQGVPSSRANIQKLRKTVDEIVETIINNKDLNVNLSDLKIYDDYTYFHSVNVGVLAILIATRMKLPNHRLSEIGMAAMLHDVGKVFVNKQILNKPGKLSDEEYTEMKSHSERGFEFLRYGFPSFSQDMLRAIMEHHERIDGKGYPACKRSSQISEYARIISLVDVFDALTSDRPYRNALTPSDAIEYIMAETNKAFDPIITKFFLSCVMPYSPGTTVRLSNGWVGIVVKNHFEASLRPHVRIIRHQVDELESDKNFKPYEIDLLNDPGCLGITITGHIDR